MKRLDEEFCRQKFDEFLRRHSSSEVIVWQEVSQQNEPPDYILQLNGKTYAVEVTSLIEKIDIQPQSQSSLGISASLSRFVNKIEEQALRNDILHGTYAVALEPLDNFSTIQDAVLAQALDYIRKTRSLESAPAEIILRQGQKECLIYKIGNKGNLVGEVISYEAKWEGEANQEFCQLLNEAITEKRHKLRNIIEPKILLLFDGYNYAHVAGNSWQECLSTNQDVTEFHTIFVVSADKNVVVYTRHQEWNHDEHDGDQRLQSHHPV